jgi:hypothetical protein
MPGEDNRLYRIGVMLLNGYGYNWYRQDNRMRADDLLVRSRASEHLASAVAALRAFEERFRRKYLPPPTREHPDPDPQHLAAVRRFRGVADRILDIDTKVRGGAVPSEDKIWRRHRDEIDTLRRLGECDAILVAAAKELADAVAGLPADAGIEPGDEQRIDQQLGQLTGVLTRRGAILAGEEL